MFAPYKHKIVPSPDSTFKRLVDYTLFASEDPFSKLDQRKYTEASYVLLGYPDDRGVERNDGRMGACEAPDAIRALLYRMTPSPLSKPKNLKIMDLGNFMSWGMELQEAHKEAQKIIAKLRSSSVKIITLGGGHDWAYSDFLDWSGPLLNLDAHLDMRPEPEDPLKKWHSGTSFRRILSESKNPPQVKIVGLQTHCNSRMHLEWSGGFSVSALFLEEMPDSIEKQWDYMLHQLELEAEKNKTADFVMSIDMDVFAQSIAPGVSAPQPLGLDPILALKLIRYLGSRLVHLGIYESNPRYDQDFMTSRLAAKFIHEYLTCS